MRGLVLVARQELASFFRGAAGVGVWVAFLAVQGASFAATLYALADPARPAPYGAVLRAHFGGTFLYWAFLFLVGALQGMRMVSLERRAGTWDLLASSPLPDWVLVAGKWLGALGAYAILWLPTLAYVAVIAAFAPEGATPDAGPIASAYLGVMLTGAAFLALAAVASAATVNPVAAAALAFAGLMAWFLAGLAPELTGAALPVLAFVDMRAHLDDFARGVIDTRHLGLYAAVIVVGLVAATQLAARPRRGRAARGRGLAGVALVALCGVLAVALVARHPRRLDVTRAGVYRLDERTRRILAEVRAPVDVLVLDPGAPEFRPLFDEVRELLAQMRAAQPLVRVESLDPAREPGRIPALADEFAIGAEELLGGGAVVFRSGERRRAVGLLDMARFGRDAAGGGALAEFSGENVFASAVLEVTDATRHTLCFTRGHHELPLEARRDGQDAAALMRVLEEDGHAVREVEDDLDGCSAVVVMGAEGVPAADAVALSQYLEKGGRLLVTLRAAPSGLETVLATWGVRATSTRVTDEAADIGLEGAWATLRGYGMHEVVAAFGGRRVTVWVAPVAVEPVDDPRASAVALVTSSGGTPVAAAAEWRGGARVVVLGSTASFASSIVEEHPPNGLLVRSAVAWLTGQRALVGVPPKTPEQLRVVMTSAQARAVAAVCVVGLPALVGLVAAAWLWWRRRA